MKGQDVPTGDHIARYCAPKTVHDGEIQATAFILRSNENELSVSWLEFLKCADRAAEIDQLRLIYSRKLTLRGTAKFAVLNVGQLIDTVKREGPDGRELSVVHEPEEDDDTHTHVCGLHHDDELVAELLVQVIQESYPARSA